MLIADWYNKSWVRGKQEQHEMVFQRFHTLLRPLANHVSYHPHAEDDKIVQTIDAVKAWVPAKP